MEEVDLKTKTTVSLFWNFIDKFGHQTLNFVSMIVLMNIVDIEDYGLIGALSVFIAFSTILIDSGFGRSLLNEKVVSDIDYSSVFYFNVLLSIVIYIILFFSSPLLGVAFNAPKIILVAQILFISLILNALGLIHQVLLIKKADFRGLARVNLTALLIANTAAIVMALKGMGVWALIAQTLLYAFFRTLFLWFYSKWRPIHKISINKLKTFFSFSNKLIASSTINVVINNIYPSLIALFYPMNQVAFFNQAKKYQDIPFITLTNTFRSVAMLILSEINNDKERLKRVLSKFVKSVSFISFPLGAILIIIAEPMFYLFFKDKWLSSVIYFQILTFAGMMTPFVFILNELFISLQKSKYFLGVEIIKGLILIVLIVVMFPKGIIALAFSWIIYTFITVIISSFLSGKLIGYGMSHLTKDIMPYILIAGISAGISFLITRNINDTILNIIANITIISASYFLICKLLKIEMIRELETWLNKSKKQTTHNEK